MLACRYHISSYNGLILSLLLLKIKSLVQISGQRLLHALVHSYLGHMASKNLDERYIKVWTVQIVCVLDILVSNPALRGWGGKGEQLCNSYTMGCPPVRGDIMIHKL